MKAASIRDLKIELNTKTKKELVELCLQMAKFKKDSKELLTYLLYEAQDEEAYIESVKIEMDELFDQVNSSSYYYVNKSMRKILRLAKKFIRYSKKKTTEFELLKYFCEQLLERHAPLSNYTLENIYDRQIIALRKIVASLHEDLQYDYGIELERLEEMK
ncbi:hypothetical protein [Reichenbachiella versicolor]|uniref:hypothetical protein n=1 Tax=Reichenbachiella versicolor TaxID=1821036 RepID=UPI000D6E2095|nr:hypothetical protein [Reichenbachiella versicolor]